MRRCWRADEPEIFAREVGAVLSLLGLRLAAAGLATYQCRRSAAWSAPEIERWAPEVEDPFAIIRSACLSERGLQISITGVNAARLSVRLADDETILDRFGDMNTILPQRTGSQNQPILSALVVAR